MDAFSFHEPSSFEKGDLQRGKEETKKERKQGNKKKRRYQKHKRKRRRNTNEHTFKENIPGHAFARWAVDGWANQRIIIALVSTILICLFEDEGSIA